MVAATDHVLLALEVEVGEQSLPCDPLLAEFALNFDISAFLVDVVVH